MSNVIGQDEKEESLIKGEWRDFSKTLAFKRLMEYTETNKEMLLRDATDYTISLNGKKVTITPEMALTLLQRRAGIDIVKTYIGLYVE